MIPCREGCAQYQEGCHKTCPRWKEMQEKLKLEKEKKKHNELIYLPNNAGKYR